MPRPTRLLTLSLALLAFGWVGSPAPAQFEFDAGGFNFDDPAFGADPGAEADPATVTAQFAPAAAGQPAMLAVTAKIVPGYHISSISQAEGGPQPTSIEIDPASGVRLLGAWTPDSPPKTKIDEEIWIGLQLEEHYGEVTWRAPVELPEGVDPTAAVIVGRVDMQACKDTCVPLDLPFTAELVPAGTIPVSPVDAGTEGVTGDTPAGVEASNAAPRTEATASISELLPILGGAFLGGLILNLMPCVLPVIGLKVLSFAEQAGHDRGKVFAMNLAYTAGLMSVFLLLAALAAFASYGWGELYTITEFKVGMIALVFAMALSFLGVWEIPLPGFAGGKEASELQQKEGFGGAFFKGVFTTILATPCSGPFLGSAIGFTLSQPSWVTFLIFSTIGLGMASPYLLIGVFPSLVKSLPKPGAWMETFKQLMGFVLLGTVVYLISTVAKDYYLPVLATLVGIGFGCWWIGSTPITAGTTKRAYAWASSVVAAVAIGGASFSLLGPSDHDLPWRPYSQAALASAQQRGQTVLVDFTADWCLTCKLNLKRAINTDAVREVVAANGVAPLLADWTDKNDEIKATLASLGSRSIPLLAIYPAGQDEPIILRDLISEAELLSALAQAGAVAGNQRAATMPEIEIGEAAPAATYR